MFPYCFLSPEDPQYMAQALTNVLLMDAVMGCLHNDKPLAAASKLVYFDKLIHQGLTLFIIIARIK